MRKKLITILGPTASGKTRLAISLAERYGGEIVCADSRTIYRDLDVGTAKPGRAEQRAVKHHLLDIIDPDQDFSAKEFKIAAQTAIEAIRARQKLPFLVGGSGMYIDSVLFDYQFRHPRLYPDVDLDGKGLDELVALATEKYPAAVNKIDTKNRRRVEQLILKGPAKDDDRINLKIDSLVLGVSTNIPTLKQNIASRTAEILNNGLVQETEELVRKWGRGNVLWQTTGYGAVMKFLDSQIGEDDLAEQINRDTLALAKKQITWFRRNQFIRWIESEDEAAALIDAYIGA